MFGLSSRAALFAFGLVSVVAISPATEAAVIYDNGVTTVNTGPASDVGTPQYAADNFMLQTGATTITGARWSGLYLTGNVPAVPDDFTLLIYANDNGKPAASPLHNIDLGAVPKGDTGADLNIANIFILDIYSYEASFGPVTLLPDTTYWLSIYNDTSADPASDWVWGAQSVSPGHPFSPDQLDWSFATFGVLDFELLGPDSVPEPGTLALLAGGLLGFVAASRRRSAMSRSSAK